MSHNHTYHTWLFNHIQGDSLPDQQTLRGDSGHEDNYYSMGNHGAQTSSVGARVR